MAQEPSARTSQPSTHNSPHVFTEDVDLAKRLEDHFKQAQTRALEMRAAGRQITNIVDCNDEMVACGQCEADDGKHDLPPLPKTSTMTVPQEPTAACRVKFEQTRFCVANCDTVTAALVLGDACALNFANAEQRGGFYRVGAKAQEEDLCRQIPQLYASLGTAQYPIAPNTALLTCGLPVVRELGTWWPCAPKGVLDIVSAAMPNGNPGASSPQWHDTVTLRIRAILHAAMRNGQPNLVLGAFGCGAYGNPPERVARIFKEQLCSTEFRGAFGCVAFAIIDPWGSGNKKVFSDELQSLSEVAQ